MKRSRCLLVLKSRGVPVPVPGPVRRRILACGDTDQLDLWLRRAASAATIEEVVGD